MGRAKYGSCEEEDIFEDDKYSASSDGEKDSEKENSESDFGAKKPTAKAKGQKKTETKVAAKKTTVAAKQATPAGKRKKAATVVAGNIAKPRSSISPSGPVRRLGLSKLSIPKNPPSPVRLPIGSNPPIFK